MIIGLCRVQCRPDRTDEMAVAIAAVEAPSRGLPGVITSMRHAASPTRTRSVVVEEFENVQALERQNEQAEVAAVLGVVQTGALARELVWTVFETTESS
jgi:quinol monooxygenase YgiN